MDAAKTDDAGSKLRRVYGRGFCDGVASMNGAKLARIESGLSTSEKKILDAVPLESGWSMAEIFHELKRLGINVDIRYMQGVLHSLLSSKLIREEKPGHYMRTKGKAVVVQVSPLHPPQPQSDLVKAVPPPVAAPAVPKPPPAAIPMTPLLARLAELASQMRGMAQSFEDLALDVEQHIQSSAAATEQLRQLRQLLQGIGKIGD